MKNTFPTWLNLMEMWLKTHHEGRSAVVVSHPFFNIDSGFAGRVEALKKLLGNEFEHLFGAEVAVFVCPSHEEAIRIVREFSENGLHALTWDGFKIANRGLDT